MRGLIQIATGKSASYSTRDLLPSVKTSSGPQSKQIPFYTWPGGREDQALEIPNTEIQFLLTADDWETHKETLTTLTQEVYKAWEASGSDE